MTIYFAVVLLGASARVITAKSTVHAALFLVLAIITALWKGPERTKSIALWSATGAEAPR